MDVSHVSNALTLLLSIAVFSAGIKPADAPDGASAQHCGQLALQLCAQLADRPATYAETVKAIGHNRDFTSLAEFQTAARKLGLESLPLKWSRQLPDRVDVPCIVPVTAAQGRPHFVVVVRMVGGKAQILDYPHASYWAPIDKLRSGAHWDGTALYLSADETVLRELELRATRPKYTATHAGLGLLAAAAIAVLIALARRRPVAPVPPIQNLA